MYVCIVVIISSSVMKYLMDLFTINTDTYLKLILFLFVCYLIYF